MILSRSQLMTFSSGILALGLLTAGAHLYLATQPDESLRFFFLLNGLGYLALLIAFVLTRTKKLHSIVDLIFIAYTLLTIILWFFLGSPREGGPWDPFDVLVKGIELLLLVELFLDFRQPHPLLREG